MKLYKLDKVKRRYGTRTILNIDSLVMEPHEIYTLIGPNGAGKTSLLKILAFLDLPTSGEMEFMGHRVVLSEKHLFEVRKQVVLLDQNPIMFTGSVWKNIEFGLKIRKLVKKERHRRIMAALEKVSMESFAHYNAQDLSGGETKRVALARALVLQPSLLLCDEPTANVDVENQEIILDIIKSANQQDRMSVIFSTHYLSQGQRLADKTLVLQHGELSDQANENIFKITITRKTATEAICQLTGQLFFTLPAAAIPPIPKKALKGKIHIDPMRILCNSVEFDPENGTILTGHVLELSQSSGYVRLLVDVGVRMAVDLTMKQYRTERPGVGDKVKLYIAHQIIEFSSLAQQ